MKLLPRRMISEPMEANAQAVIQNVVAIPNPLAISKSPGVLSPLVYLGLGSVWKQGTCINLLFIIKNNCIFWIFF